MLDESTGSTLIIVQHPLVFARARSDVAAHTRDFVTLVATREDRSGKFTTWLIAHRWSTVDPRMTGDTGTGTALRIIADDREIDLKPAAPAPGILDRGDLLFAPHSSSARSAAYPIDLATLRYIAGSRTLSVRYSDDPLALAYTIWADGRPALLDLLSESKGS